MKIRIFLILFTVSGMLGSSAVGQGKIVLLNGKEKKFTTAEIKGDVVVYQPEGMSKPAERKIDKYDVFSIVRNDTGEELIYNPDTVAGEDPTVGEVRDYIKGERYAAMVYRKPLNLISGIAVGAAGSFIGFYGLVVPVAYPALLGQFTPKLKEPLAHNYYNEKTGLFELKDSSSAPVSKMVTDAFSAGYGKKARNMKIKNSLIGGGIGFAVGITAFILILGND